ncbi:hypothetical protein ILUMI_23982 [Ignelater luminosus]|uniref:Transposase n=1 Tax=Ignelater luminosus TaxID=2038154 RepID=A0A8K0G1F0_IGNLU|nr:hypothetical protein ILUMI_23982 [Ignelater luminosus]
MGYFRIVSGSAPHHGTLYDSGNESFEEKSHGLSKYATWQVFSNKEETELEMYLKQSFLYGLTYMPTRKLAYKYATKLQKKFPVQWHVNQMAGTEWMRSLMKWYPRLSLRKAENTSTERASAFNKHNVDVFFNNYAEVQAKYKFKRSHIWNTDETGISTVIQAPRVIVQTGKRVIGQCVSTERDTTVLGKLMKNLGWASQEYIHTISPERARVEELEKTGH